MVVSYGCEIMEWKYGDSWEKYPIEKGELWEEETTGSYVMVYDIYDEFPGLVSQADMIYVDPPWNTGNINSFYTKAKIPLRREFSQFTDRMFDLIKYVLPSVTFIEMGYQHGPLVKAKLSEMYPFVNEWDITYYNRGKNLLIRGSDKGTTTDYKGLDDEVTPEHAILSEKPECVLDFCMGLGCTGLTAYKHGTRFIGLELNKRRLANLMNDIAKLGGSWRKL